MRILFITTGYLPYTFSENLCNAKLIYALQEKGWEVDVISKKDEGPTYCSQWQSPWLPLKAHTDEISYPTGGKLLRLFDIIRSTIQMGQISSGIRWACRAYQLALKMHKNKHYDVVLTRSPSDIPHLVGFKLKQKTGIRWIANWNDPAATIWPEPYTHHFSPIKFRIINNNTVRYLRYADINTFPSHTLLNHFILYYPFLKDKKTVVIPHIGLSDSIFPHLNKTERQSKMYMCHSGNLSKERNPELLFQALRELIDEGHCCLQLDIMGSINDFTQSLIQKYALDEYVHFIGGYPYMEAIRKMASYDVLVLLEAIMQKGIYFPSKLTDYAQLEKPILAISPTDGFAHDMIEQYGGGIATDNTDCQSIKHGILTLYNAWEKDNLDKEYNSKRLFENFSSDKVVEIYNTLL